MGQLTFDLIAYIWVKKAYRISLKLFILGLAC